MNGVINIPKATDMQVVRSLQPDAIAALGDQYTAAFNTLLRRELRLYTSTLRKQIALSAALSSPDVALAKPTKKVRPQTTSPGRLTFDRRQTDSNLYSE